MSVPIQIILSDKLYLRDPMQSDLGRKILDQGISLIDELGFEKFTFKKLAVAINSTEASIYRYFKNKHKLLIYLVSWYWAWLLYMIDWQTHNVLDSSRKLKLTLETLANAATFDPNFAHINEAALHRIVVAESSKAFLTKEIDGENEEGLFQGYKALVQRIAGLISEINPEFQFPRALAVTTIESSRKQLFFAEHIPSLTEVSAGNDNKAALAEYLETLVLRAIDRH